MTDQPNPSDAARACAERIVSLFGHIGNMHVNDILPDIEAALTQHSAAQADELAKAQKERDEARQFAERCSAEGAKIELILAPYIGNTHGIWADRIKAGIDALRSELAQAKADTARLDLLEQQQGCNLCSDDGERWAVSTAGTQPCPEEGGFKETVGIMCVVDPEEWQLSIRAAIDSALATQNEDHAG